MKDCFLIKRDLVVTYVYPVYGGRFDTFARRFVDTYKATMPKIPHRLVVVSNGGRPNRTMEQTFSGVQVVWELHNNAGYDIGAFQHASAVYPCELMAYFSNSAYFIKPGWLERMLEASDKHGLALYGCMGNSGDRGAGVYPHIRTTGFWLCPELMNQYPIKVIAAHQRYEFEHGKTSLSEWVKYIGLERWVVTWDSVYPHPNWEQCPNCYHRGDQSGILSGDRLTTPPFYPPGS